MANTLTYKNADGNIRTVVFNPSHPVTVHANTDSQEWELIAEDPVNSAESVEYVGGRPKDRG